jgi:hypothetical protein
MARRRLAWCGVYPAPKPPRFDPLPYLADYPDLLEINTTFDRAPDNHRFPQIECLAVQSLQSTLPRPASSSSPLVRLKIRLPKKPRVAESGEGWGAPMIS